MRLGDKVLNHKSTGLLKNGVWGIGANLVQLIFLSLFFVIVARKYSVDAFAQFLIATTIYQLIAAFSSMGLGQWFIRSFLTEADQQTLTNKFLKTQIGLGLLFYLVNVGFAFSVYADENIRWLSIILGAHIVIDNFINAIKSLNIAEARQNKTGKVMLIDGFLKLMVGCLLFIMPFSTLILAALTVLVRLCTISLFLKIGSSGTNTFSLIAKARLSFQDLKSLVFKNWRFVIIGSVSILYWRAGNIIISKMLMLADVADYELAFRIFSIFQILPVIASATIFPQFIKYVQEGNMIALKQLYRLLFFMYTGAAVLAYGFIFSFAGAIIPLAFGNHYPHAVGCLQQMFLSFLIMPTVLLQANLIVALGMEHKDMHFNLISLVLNIGACLIGLYYFKSLSVVNYSIFLSLIVFHVLQDFLLIKKKIVTVRHGILFYTIAGGTAICFQIVPAFIGLPVFYFLFTLVSIGIITAVSLYHREMIKAIIGIRPMERKTIW